MSEKWQVLVVFGAVLNLSKMNLNNFHMGKFKLILCFYGCMNLFSCNQSFENKKADNSPLISVDLPQNHQIINLSNDFRRVGKWHTDNDYLYFISEKQLYVYDYEGDLVFSLLTEPQNTGNNCYVTDVKSNNDKIFILCEDRGIVKVINKSSWDISNTIDIGVKGSSIEATEESLFVYQTSNTLNLEDKSKNYQLSIFDLEGNIINRFFPYEKSKDNSYQFSVAVVQTFSKFHDKVSFTRFMNDTVYYFNSKGDEISHNYLGFNSNQQEGLTNQEMMVEGKNKNIAYYPVYFTFNDQYEAILYLKSLKLNLSLYDKKSGRGYNISTFDDQISNARLIPAVKIYEDNLFVLISDEAVIGMNEERIINNKSLLGKNLNQLKNYEKYQILLRFNINDLQF